MIRRELLDADSRRRWLLISQVDHARLAAELAAGWAFPDEMQPHAAAMLAAIYHHDDGWDTWDACPQIDPASGIPRAFNEMPLADSLAIWRSSIAVAADLGPLQAYVVAGHFSALLGRFDSWRAEGGEQRKIAEEFLTEYGLKMTNWLLAWQSSDQPKISHPNSELVAQFGVHRLQFFDALSLWLCCGARSESTTLGTPAGSSVTLTPLDSGKIQIQPWPFAVNYLEFAVSGRAVAARHYASSNDLAAAPAESERISWRLVS